jgi:hypothetical protein
VDEQNKHSFHMPGSDYRWVLRGKVRGAFRRGGVSESSEDLFSQFRKVDRLFVTKYGCKRCPSFGTDDCPYGVGFKRREPMTYRPGFNEVVIPSKDEPTTTEERSDVRSEATNVARSAPVGNTDSTVTEASSRVTQTREILLESHKHGICDERVRELGFYANKVSSIHGLVIERSETLQEMHSIKEALRSKVSDLIANESTFKAEYGDEKFKTAITQYMDILERKEKMINNAITQEIKFKELVEKREQSKMDALEIDSITQDLKKMLTRVDKRDSIDTMSTKETDFTPISNEPILRSIPTKDNQGESTKHSEDNK